MLRKVKKCSNGQKKRIQFIRALLYKPDLILCDEPTAALDHENAKMLMEALKEGVGLRGYAQSKPLQVYALEGFEMFDNMMATISGEISQFLLNAEVRQNTQREEVKNIRASHGKEESKRTPKKAAVKVGRNDPCPCGSGKKYKQCCGK